MTHGHENWKLKASNLWFFSFFHMNPDIISIGLIVQVAYEDFVTAGSIAAAREKGLVSFFVMSIN